MPIIYLSPSTQENNYYVTGGTEEYYMNRLADAIVPYLVSNGIQYVRNTPDMTAGSSIRQANAGWYDFYLALHSNAAGEGNYGNVRASSPFTIHTASMESGRQTFLWRISGRSIRCPTMCALRPPRR